MEEPRLKDWLIILFALAVLLVVAWFAYKLYGLIVNLYESVTYSEPDCSCLAFL